MKRSTSHQLLDNVIELITAVQASLSCRWNGMGPHWVTGGPLANSRLLRVAPREQTFVAEAERSERPAICGHTTN